MFSADLQMIDFSFMTPPICKSQLTFTPPLPATSLSMDGADLCFEIVKRADAGFVYSEAVAR